MSFTSARPRARPSARDCAPDAFRALAGRRTGPAGLPHATAVEQGVPVYDAARVEDGPALRDEPARALADGPGIVVFRVPSRTRRSSTGSPPSSTR
ncbi:hypothetical protein ACIF8T_32910 [Streptomyces sp. NPDC085946]|uniref:hypothetical protein n=1 Tax=Streptomyces sp. NPDC085946 TaxID=3365744 RepID=UPI0037D87945